MGKGEILLPVATPIVKPSRHLTTPMFTDSKMFTHIFLSRHYVSVYGEALSYYIVQDNALKEARRKADSRRKVQIEVYSSWLLDGVLTEKLMREFPDPENATLTDVLWNAVKYLKRSGPFGKRTPAGMRDEDRNWKLYTDENGVERLRLSLEYQKVPVYEAAPTH
jgi:hypothetical protein